MGSPAYPPASRRALFVDERGNGMRATWHAEAGLVVLSLWRGEECVGTFRMGPHDAARLASFLVDHLGEQAGEAVARAVPLPPQQQRDHGGEQKQATHQ